MSEPEKKSDGNGEEAAAPAIDFEPKIVAFACTYCSYTAADLAGSMRLSYSTKVRIVKILCTGRIDTIFLLKAFEEGADAVYVAGCEIGDCHFLEGNIRGKQVVQYTKKLLAELGIEPERLEFFHIAASDGPKFAEVADEMTQRARRLGPNPIHARAMGIQTPQGGREQAPSGEGEGQTGRQPA